MCSLDFVAGVGAGARLDLVHDEYDAHALLMQDYAIRERLEAILENVTSVFMGDFDRNLDSFRLARALAYANRRLNDEITLIMGAGQGAQIVECGAQIRAGHRLRCAARQ